MSLDPSIPVLDISPLLSRADSVGHLADQIRVACREWGFFYVVGHDVDLQLIQQLEQVSQQFFAMGLEDKLAIRMERGGRAWRGYFPLGDELTSGQPDQKEGLYFGAELDEDDPRVRAGLPLHGRNLFPEIAGFRETVLGYLTAMTRLGHTLMEGIALSLGFDTAYFADRYTRDPFILFRIFHYPPLTSQAAESTWSVGEHTDYGILTILLQDTVGGLQVKSPAGWIAAPPLPGSFVCNIGDMLDRMTGGVYRSTPHRVLNKSTSGRLSYPFFFDPSFDSEVRPIDSKLIVAEDKLQRWDGASVHEFHGTYGDYLLEKVSQVFPELGQREL